MKKSKAGTAAQKLAAIRREIDRADRLLLKALALRFKAVSQVSALKQELGLPARQDGRWRLLLKARLESAVPLKLSPSLVKKIFSAIHGESLRQQNVARRKKTV